MQTANTQSYAQRTLVFGVGVNDSDYHTRREPGIGACLFYARWGDMLRRCYGPREPSYADCSVSDEWLLFSNFKSWMTSQDWVGRELDKDLRVPGNKVYSSDTCLFIDGKVNNVFKKPPRKTNLPVGVSHGKRAGSFQSQCRMGGKPKHLGYFDTVSEAKIAWASAKAGYVIALSENPEYAYIKEVLRNHADLLLLGAHPLQIGGAGQ